ncbi:MAG: SDR family NAD(P)-dependent oxidoreductase [Bacteroidota bacterium]
MQSFENKVILVTGSTGGIGQAAAKQFAEKGAKVVISGRRKEKGDQVVKDIKDAGGEALFVAIDIANKESIKSGLESAVSKYGKIDVLVANAGREQPTTAPIDQLPDEEVDMIIDTNMKGSYFTIKYALNHMNKPGASICVVSSLWSLLGGPGLTAYTATKGGINALTKSLAVEQGPAGVRINCISPGAIETDMLNRFTQGADMSAYYQANMPLQRAGKAEEVARAIVWISSDEASYITGETLSVDGGVTNKMSTAGL